MVPARIDRGWCGVTGKAYHATPALSDSISGDQFIRDGGNVLGTRPTATSRLRGMGADLVCGGGGKCVRGDAPTNGHIPPTSG